MNVLPRNRTQRWWSGDVIAQMSRLKFHAHSFYYFIKMILSSKSTFYVTGIRVAFCYKTVWDQIKLWLWSCSIPYFLKTSSAAIRRSSGVTANRRNNRNCTATDVELSRTIWKPGPSILYYRWPWWKPNLLLSKICRRSLVYPKCWACCEFEIPHALCISLLVICFLVLLYSSIIIAYQLLQLAWGLDK